MDKVNQFRARAAECRKLAASSPAGVRQHYETLALMWDKLAEERLAFFLSNDEKATQPDGTDNGPNTQASPK